MLFTKKNRFAVGENQIKDELTAPDGTAVLKLNLRYPAIECPKHDPLRTNAVPLYAGVANGLALYARGELYKAALAAYSARPENFIPYSVVMRWENTFEDAEYLSILLDISVCDGMNPQAFERKTQVWDRARGTKCRFSHFFAGKSAQDIIGEEAKKHFDRELFVLRGDRIEFFVRQESGYRTVAVMK